MIQVKVSGLIVDDSSKSPVVILQELEGERGKINAGHPAHGRAPRNGAGLHRPERRASCP